MKSTSSILGIILIVIICTFITIINLDLPIVRNSVIYYNLSSRLIDGSISFYDAARFSASHGRPLGYSIFSIPFICLFGDNSGMIISSYFSGLLLIIISTIFHKSETKISLKGNQTFNLFIIFMFINPLMIYQFWSAYPDLLYSVLFLLSFILFQQILFNNKRSFIIILSYLFVVYMAILVKYHAIFIIPLHLIAFLLYSKKVALTWGSDRHFFIKIFILGMLFGLILLISVLGKNPSLDLSSNMFDSDSPVAIIKNGFSGSIVSIVKLIIINLIGFVFFIIITFNFNIYFLFKSIKNSKENQLCIIICCLFLLSLLPLQGVFMNIRYYIPIIPFIAILILKGYLDTKKIILRKMILILSIIINTILILNFNVKEIYNSIDINSHFNNIYSYLFVGSKPIGNSNSNIVFSDQENEKSKAKDLLEFSKGIILENNLGWYLFDNFKISQHLCMNDALKNINQKVTRNKFPLYIVMPNYYNHSLNYSYNRLGFIDPTISSYYFNDYSSIPKSNGSYYIFASDFSMRPKFFEHKQTLYFGKGLYLISGEK